MKRFAPLKNPGGSPRKASRQTSRIEGVVYVLGFGNYVKIGWTSNLDKRLRDIEQDLPGAPTLLGSMVGSRRKERSLHLRFQEYRTRGEWFRREGRLAEWIDVGPSVWDQVRRDVLASSPPRPLDSPTSVPQVSGDADVCRARALALLEQVASGVGDVHYGKTITDLAKRALEREDDRRRDVLDHIRDDLFGDAA